MNSPSPTEIRQARKEAGLTQAQAAELIHSVQRTWYKWESGERTMHPAFWELFLIKVGRR